MLEIVNFFTLFGCLILKVLSLEVLELVLEHIFLTLMVLFVFQVSEELLMSQQSSTLVFYNYSGY